MAAEKNPFRRIRLVYRRSSNLVKGILLATIVVCTAVLLALSIAIGSTERKTETLRQEAAALEQKNQELEQDIRELGTIESMKKLATELLGLFDPDTVIFIPEE